MITCDKCDGAVRVMVDVTVGIPGELAFALTKASLRRADVEIWGAGWDRMTVICQNSKCRYILKITTQAVRAAMAAEGNDTSAA